MRTVVLGPRPAELQALIERRRRLGLDGRDEIREGDYYMAPAAHQWHGFIESQIAITFAPHVQRAGLVQTGPFNLGDADDYRIPDAGVHERLTDSVWIPTALLVVEILSPDDESEAKLPFYAAAGVREAVLVDSRTRMLRWLSLDAVRPPVQIEHSEVLAADPDAIAAAITWPS